jgi:hypothetical protein
MSSSTLPVVVAAAASSAPSSGVGTTIGIPPTGDHINANENFVDNYDLDGDGADDYTLCDKWGHIIYGGGGIVRDHWAVCKAVQGCSHLSSLNSKSIIQGLLLVKKIHLCREADTLADFRVSEAQMFVSTIDTVSNFSICVDVCVPLRTQKNGFLVFSEKLLILRLCKAYSVQYQVLYR